VKELVEINKKCKQDLYDLDVNYTAQIKKIRAEHKDEIEALKQKAEDDAQKAADRLDKVMKDHEEKRFRLKSQIAQLMESNSSN
jgi:hypothetical protein